MARPAIESLSCLRIGIDDFGSRSLARIHDRLSVGLPEFSDVTGLDVLELHSQHASMCPSTALSELHLTDHGLECCRSCVLGQRHVIQAAYRLNCLLQYLQLG